MTPRFVLMALGLAGLVATPVVAQDSDAASPPALTVLDAASTDLASFQWVMRPVVVFADSPADPRFTEQMRLLQERPMDMVMRDVVVITDTDPDAGSALRKKLRPRGFMMVLIGKDGQVKLRKPAPWSAREIGRSIDKMPMRQREIREGHAGSG